MIIYLVKSTLLLALLLSVYKLLLENEKMHQFNRFFLLFALIFGLTAPLITFDLNPETSVAGINVQSVKSIVDKPSEIVSNSVTPLLTPKTSVELKTEVNSTPAISEPNLFTLKNILLGLYACITFMLLLRFISGLMEIVRNVRAGEKQKLETATLVLLKEKIMPQSFFRFIFLNEKGYRSGTLGSEILEHELTHVNQLHSLDVLAVEFLKVIFWFNPLFYFYKHAVQLNHEFLADEGAINSLEDVQNYQSILLDFTSDANSKKLTSRLNFSLTKRRLALIGKTSSVSHLYFKFLPVLIAFTFSPFMFFDQREKSPETFATTHEEYWANQIYSDVSLEFQGFPYGEDGIDLSMRIPSLKLLNGNPYSGVENFYLKKNDLLDQTTVYVDGLPVHQKSFDDQGNERSSIDFIYNPQKTRRFSTRYYEYGKLRSETVFSSPDHDGREVHRFWNSEGNFRTLMFLESDDSETKENELINYDSLGNVIFHEIRKDGELVEKIK